MSEVTRYDMVEHTRGMESWQQMEKRADGDYVTFEDFELATKARDGVFSQIVKSITDEKETLKRRVAWFLSLTEGMLSTEQVAAIMEEIKP